MISTTPSFDGVTVIVMIIFFVMSFFAEATFVLKPTANPWSVLQPESGDKVESESKFNFLNVHTPKSTANVQNPTPFENPVLTEKRRIQAMAKQYSQNLAKMYYSPILKPGAVRQNPFFLQSRTCSVPRIHPTQVTKTAANGKYPILQEKFVTNRQFQFNDSRNVFQEKSSLIGHEERPSYSVNLAPPKNFPKYQEALQPRIPVKTSRINIDPIKLLKNMELLRRLEAESCNLAPACPPSFKSFQTLQTNCLQKSLQGCGDAINAHTPTYATSFGPGSFDSLSTHSNGGLQKSLPGCGGRELQTLNPMEAQSVDASQVFQYGQSTNCKKTSFGPGLFDSLSTQSNGGLQKSLPGCGGRELQTLNPMEAQSVGDASQVYQYGQGIVQGGQTESDYMQVDDEMDIDQDEKTDIDESVEMDVDLNLYTDDIAFKPDVYGQQQGVFPKPGDAVSIAQHCKVAEETCPSLDVEMVGDIATVEEENDTAAALLSLAKLSDGKDKTAEKITTAPSIDSGTRVPAKKSSTVNQPLSELENMFSSAKIGFGRTG